MSISRTWFPLLVSACLGVSAGRLAAEDSADFWATHTSWQKAAVDIHRRIEGDAAEAINRKRPAETYQIYEKGYESYLRTLGKGKGIDPIRDSVQHSLFTFRIQWPVLGANVEAQEKELRAFWTTMYKPNRTGDFLVLYTRYMGDRKYRDAVRIAEECYRDYGWTWEARTWLERIISAMAPLPEMKEALSARVEEYHDSHMTQLGAYSTMLAGLGYLYADGEFDQAARLVESCLAAYKDCEWEPQFLLKAVTIHTARVDAMNKESAKPAAKPAPAASKPAVAPVTAGRAKTAQSTRPPVPPARPASEIKSADCAVAAAKRCVEIYPHEPLCAEAVLRYFQWALAEGREPALREEAGQLVVKYLTAYKAAPYWNQLYQAGRRWADKGEPTWMALDATSQAYAGSESNRNAQLQVAMEVPTTNRMPCAKALSEFVAAYPDTVQARNAFARLTSLVLTGNWEPDFKEIQGMATNVLSLAFPASPMYRRQQLAALSVSGIEPESTDIAKALIDEAKTPIQKEWAYFWNLYRYTQCGRYDIPAFKLWVENYRDSYFVPDQLAIVTARAIYNQKTEEASEACDAAACKELGNSLVMASQLGANIWQWIRYARDKAIKDEESGKAAGKRKGTKVLEREALMKANEQANIIDEAQTGKIDLGFFYYYATAWDDLIDFKTKHGMSAKQILKQKDYRGSYYYFYSKAYEKDR